MFSYDMTWEQKKILRQCKFKSSEKCTVQWRCNSSRSSSAEYWRPDNSGPRPGPGPSSSRHAAVGGTASSNAFFTSTLGSASRPPISAVSPPPSSSSLPGLPVTHLHPDPRTSNPSAVQRPHGVLSIPDNNRLFKCKDLTMESVGWEFISGCSGLQCFPAVAAVASSPRVNLWSLSDYNSWETSSLSFHTPALFIMVGIIEQTETGDRILTWGRPSQQIQTQGVAWQSTQP